MKFERAFRVTIIDNANLLERLARELRFVFHQVRLAWPALKRDPIGFSRRTVVEVGLSLRRAAAPDSIAAAAANHSRLAGPSDCAQHELRPHQP